MVSIGCVVACTNLSPKHCLGLIVLGRDMHHFVLLFPEVKEYSPQRIVNRFWRAGEEALQLCGNLVLVF